MAPGSYLGFGVTNQIQNRVHCFHDLSVAKKAYLEKVGIVHESVLNIYLVLETKNRKSYLAEISTIHYPLSLLTAALI